MFHEKLSGQYFGKRKSIQHIFSPNYYFICFLGEINAFGVAQTMTTNDISALRKCVYRG